MQPLSIYFLSFICAVRKNALQSQSGSPGETGKMSPLRDFKQRLEDGRDLPRDKDVPVSKDLGYMRK